MYISRPGATRSPGSAMLAAAEANHLSVFNCVRLTTDGQHVITASLCGPPQVRNVMVGRSFSSCYHYCSYNASLLYRRKQVLLF